MKITSVCNESINRYFALAFSFGVEQKERDTTPLFYYLPHVEYLSWIRLHP